MRYVSRKVRTKVNFKTVLIIYLNLRLKVIYRVEFKIMNRNDVAGNVDGDMFQRRSDIYRPTKCLLDSEK